MIAVIGAGLAGLTAALALMRAGWRVRVYEQAPELGEVGAGISVSAGMAHGLASLGLGDALLAASSPVPDVAFVHYATGALLAGTLDGGVPPDLGLDSARHIHRADLHGILLEGVRTLNPDAVVTGKELYGIVEQDATVRASFADGGAVEAELLIGADGARSAVRRLLFDPAPPEFAGQVAFRCLVPREEAAPYMGAGSAAVSVGPGRIFHRYPVRHGSLVNIIGIARDDRWREEDWNIPATTGEFLGVYADFHPNVRGLIASAAPGSLIKWALYTRPPLAGWSHGRALLVGDAAHPILPFLGLGAALAIEDGIILGRMLNPGADVGEVFAAFETHRRPRVEAVRVATLRQGEMIQSADPETAGLDQAPAADKALFDYDPSGVPLHG